MTIRATDVSYLLPATLGTSQFSALVKVLQGISANFTVFSVSINVLTSTR
ncbi:hypothetical protein DSOL_1167 [Desulfosporosinus metallidurans]|uniref:Uncharacterized protein n=1 Tax=Desulfosporosinus metallidurans TaxID=1888891 RepID=A0A1Q8R0G9_9FIRM|nr:hypothetical protein DSOL_1167 [Desulfosporosinus metallidurans]